jgi:hypothetical protein
VKHHGATRHADVQDSEPGDRGGSAAIARETGTAREGETKRPTTVSKETYYSVKGSEREEQGPPHPSPPPLPSQVNVRGFCEIDETPRGFSGNGRGGFRERDEAPPRAVGLKELQQHAELRRLATFSDEQLSPLDFTRINALPVVRMLDGAYLSIYLSIYLYIYTGCWMV